MKKVFLILIIPTVLFSSLMGKAVAQQTNSISKVESIIQLTKFIDISGNSEFLHNKRMLYVLANYNSPINIELRSKKDIFYKNWQIICCDKLSEFEAGSVVFITKEKQKLTAEIINLSTKKDILTISENDENFCMKGGMINLLEKEDKIRFEINYRIIQNKSLEISSKILALAKIYD